MEAGTAFLGNRFSFIRSRFNMAVSMSEASTGEPERSCFYGTHSQKHASPPLSCSSCRGEKSERLNLNARKRKAGEAGACPKTRPELSPRSTSAPPPPLNSGVACRWHGCRSVDSRWRPSHARLATTLEALQHRFPFNSGKHQEQLER